MKSIAKKILIFLAVMAVVALAGWFGRKAYKKAQEHSLIAQAKQYFDKKDWRNGELCLQRALQVNPLSVDAGRTIGDLLDSAGVPTALTWRARAVKLQPDNLTNRFLWAQSAIKLKDLKTAQEALDSIPENAKSTAEYHKLKGALTWNLGQPIEAELNYAEALRLEPTNDAIVLNLETIRLVSTNKTVAGNAQIALETMTNAVLRPIALQHLLTAAVNRRDLVCALAYSREIVTSPTASTSDKINHLQLLRDAKSPETEAYLAKLKTAAQNSPAIAFALGQWLVKTEKAEAALAWLQALPPLVQTNLPVPLAITDCEIILKDWSGLLAFVKPQAWGELEYYRMGLETLARRSLGETTAAESSWRKALHLAAHNQERLSRLVQMTTAWGWSHEKTDLLEQIVQEFPAEKSAVNQLVGQYYADGKSRELQKLLTESQAANPGDVQLKNNLATILLLRKSELDKAGALAKEAYDSATNNPFYSCTYAYALFTEKKTGEALKILADLKPESLKIPAVATYYGAIQALSGNKEAARSSLDLAETAKLLPEELELIRQAKAGL